MQKSHQITLTGRKGPWSTEVILYGHSDSEAQDVVTSITNTDPLSRAVVSDPEGNVLSETVYPEPESDNA